MKRLGVQLAAGGVVILLGALGVAQAQRDSQKAQPDEWDVQAPPPTNLPVPIAAIDDHEFPASATGFDPSGTSPAFAQPAYEKAAFALPASQSGDDPWSAAPQSIRQVAHEDSFAPPPLGGQPDDQSREQAGDALGDVAAAGPAGFSWPLPTSSDAMAAPPAQHSAQIVSPTEGDFEDSDPGPTAPLYQDAAVQPGFAPTPVEYDAAEGPMNFAAGPVQADQPPSADMTMLPLAAGPVNELRDPPAPTEAPAAIATDGPAADRAPASEPAYPSYDAPQYQAVPYAAEQAIMSPQPLRPSEAPHAFDPAAQAAAPQPLHHGEGFGQIDPQADAYHAIDHAPAAAPVARIASAAPVPLVGLDEAAMETTLNEPGDRRLDGMQSPSIIIQKRAPDQVKVGKPASFVIQVQNVGGVEALGVQVHDRIPAGMRLIDASPQPQQHGDLLIWQLGALEPGGERTVSMQLIPEQEGELGSVARVTFEAAASVRTISTRPAIKIKQRAPERVLIGQQLEIELEVSNPGTGAATGVIMQTDVPEGLEHPKGRQLDNSIGTLAPGEARRQVLRLRAVAPGLIDNEVRLIGDDGLTAEDTVTIEVIAPQLAIELEGPTRRFLERQATYQINLANVGSAEATNVEIVAYLDRGFSFVGTEYQGQYDPTRHAVYWSLAELPPEGRGSVPLTLLPIEKGERAIRLEARGDLNLIARHEKKVNIDALAELTFSITDDADPIEVGSTVTYEVRITNRGSGEDADVSLQLQLPPAMELVSSDNDASTDGNGLVVFAPQSVMAARSEIVHRIRVRGTAPGTHLVKAIVSSRESPVQVTKEESTTVYADQ